MSSSTNGKAWTHLPTYVRIAPNFDLPRMLGWRFHHPRCISDIGHKGEVSRLITLYHPVSVMSTFNTFHPDMYTTPTQIPQIGPSRHKVFSP